jgi:peptidoglycan/xylan/chitin deacetylase (PgdA/CDA1 family)
MTPVQWSVETGDPDKNITAKAILKTVKAKAKGGSIVIMHANGRGWHSAEALPGVIDYLHSKGYEIVTVSELLAGR